MTGVDPTANLLIRGGRVVDPSLGIDRHMDVWIADGCIAALGDGLEIPLEQRQSGPSTRILEVPGCVVAPGFLDVHTHLREPGFEYKETIASGLAAAASCCFTSLAAMANTQPVNTAVTELMLRRATAVRGTRLYPIGAVSAGLAGEELSEIGGMHEAGIVALSDDGMPVMNARLMRRAMEYGRMLGLPVLSHCEDHGLTANGVMHEGVVSTALGLPGIPAAAENVMVYRDIQLAAMTGAHVHIQHVSTAEAVDLVRRAKDQDIRVTAEVCPHHFTLTHERSGNTIPIPRSIRCAGSGYPSDGIGLQDGTIVCASDHAPHHVAKRTGQISPSG